MPTVIVNTDETTFVSSAFSNTNFSSFPVMFVGTDPGFQICTGLLKFTLPPLPATAVDSALLQLFVVVKNGAEPSNVVVNRVTEPFDADVVTYATQPDFAPTVSQVDITTEDVLNPIQIDVTELVNQWLSGAHANNGIALTDSDDSTLVQFATNNIGYPPFYPELILSYSDAPVVPKEAYGYIYNTGNQSIPVEGAIPFTNNGALLGISRNVGTLPITIETPGTYAVWFTITGQDANQFALFQNDTLVPGSIYGIDVPSSNNSGMVIINAQQGDVLSLHNHTSDEAIVLGNSIGGAQTNVSASILLLKIGPPVDPDNIYVKAGSVGGNGSITNPFGTIPQGIAAVNPGGTVRILSGTYPITSQINVNKAGVTLLGESGTILSLQANVIPILVTGDGVILNSLTVTSDIPYQREFIQVGAPNVELINNTVFGPVQEPPMSDWVVNRAVVSQGSVSNITLKGNTFYSLRTGMYINPNTTGAINDNVVYNTKGGFLVDRAFTTFEGNSWGTPENEFDIVLLVGTTMGPPYDNTEALSEENSNATISDQR